MAGPVSEMHICIVGASEASCAPKAAASAMTAFMLAKVKHLKAWGGRHRRG